MKHLVCLLVATCLIVTASAPAEAQQRRRARSTPDAGMWAVGGSIGATAPDSASLGNGVEIGGLFEGYLTRNLSVRGQVQTAMWDFQPQLGFTGTLQPVFVGGNVVYSLEGGNWHPYVTAGAGVYHYHWTEPGVPDGTNSYGGLNMGGGAEFFFTRDATITAELLYHRIGDVDVARATLHDGSFWSFAMGAKKYF